MKILIADDYHPFRTGLAQAIGKYEGLEVVGQARDGMEAIILAKSCKPDVIFLDISMPNVNGLEAARQIREQCPESKIVFVTVHTEETYRALAKILAVDGYIAKGELSAELPGLIARLQRSYSGGGLK